MAESARHFPLRYRSLIQTLQSQHRDCSIRAAAAKPGTDRNVLDEFDSCLNSVACKPFERPDRLDDKVGFAGFHTVLDELEMVRQLDPDVIRPVDGLQNRADLMVAIVTPAQNSQIKINLGERLQLHRDVNKSVVLQAQPGTKHEARNTRRSG